MFKEFKVYDDGDSKAVIKQKCIDFIKYMIEIGVNDGEYYVCESSHYVSFNIYQPSPDVIRAYWECEICGDEDEVIELFFDYDTLKQYQRVEILQDESEDI